MSVPLAGLSADGQASGSDASFRLFAPPSAACFRVVGGGPLGAACRASHGSAAHVTPTTASGVAQVVSSWP